MYFLLAFHQQNEKLKSGKTTELLGGRARGSLLWLTPETKPDETHCALISAETKTDSASATVTMSSLVLGKPAPWSPVAGWCRPPLDLPALGAPGPRASPAPLAGLSVLLVPHQGAVVAQALHAVPPVPAAPAEVLEADLIATEERPGLGTADVTRRILQVGVYLDLHGSTTGTGGALLTREPGSEGTAREAQCLPV